MEIVKFNTGRDTYDKIDAARGSITVSELIEILEGMPQGAKVIYSNDGGYTYGYIDEDCLSVNRNVVNVTSSEEEEIEHQVEGAVETLVDEGKLSDDSHSADLLEIFDTICETGSIIEEEHKAYARKYIKQVY